jgi:fluoroquinolone transport system ATP-binding protein
MIEIKDLTFTYPGVKEQVLKGLTFTIEQGEIFGFLGPNGAGKSTTQKILLDYSKSTKAQFQFWGRICTSGNQISTKGLGFLLKFLTTSRS